MQNNKTTRNTKQRALILEIIRLGHLDADDIYRLAREKYPRISLSTVYRTLHRFKQQGMIDAHSFGETHKHYELKEGGEHYHIVCAGCGKVIEFEHPVTRYFKKNIEALRNFKVTNIDLKITGYCQGCRDNKT